LKVLIRGTPIQALYAHNMELLPRQGPFVEQADLAFSFSSPVRIYGIHEETPSDLHHLDCIGLDASSKATVHLPDTAKEVSSVQCTLRPILFQGSDTHPFRVTIATDKSVVPRVLAAAKNLDLVPADQFSPKEESDRDRLLSVLWPLIGLFLFSVGVFLATGKYFERKYFERKN
jgi:hypothetical protein